MNNIDDRNHPSVRIVFIIKKNLLRRKKSLVNKVKKRTATIILNYVDQNLIKWESLIV